MVQRSFIQSGNSHEKQYSIQNEYNDDACEKLALDQSELIYNQMLENFANMCINKTANDSKLPQPPSLQSPDELLNAEHDQSDPEEKPTSPHAFENESITTIVVSGETPSQEHGDN